MPRVPGRALCLLIGWLGAVSQAHAHAAPEARQLLFSSSGAPRLVVANRGLIFADEGADGAPGWELMCNEALGVATSQPPDLVALSNGTLLASTPSGLWQSTDRACSWQQQNKLSVTSLVQSTANAEQLWMTAAQDDAAGVYVSQDAGRSWQQRAARPSEYVRSVRLAASDPKRVYAASSRVRDGSLEHFVLRSQDGGASWDTLPLPLLADEAQPVLLGVSPKDARLLLAKAQGADPSKQRDRLLISDDGGESFRAAVALYVISAVAFGDGGGPIWVASEEGLYRSTDQAQSFQRVGPADVLSCVAQHAGKLYVCGLYDGIAAQHDGVGVSQDAGETFMPWLAFQDVSSPLTCAADATTSQRCGQLWTDWAREQLGQPTSAPTAAADAGQGVTNPPTAARGCSAVSGARGTGTSLCALLLLLLAAVRGTRGKRPPQGQPCAAVRNTFK